jgi:rhodanese-related sulfurtransferase
VSAVVDMAEVSRAEIERRLGDATLVLVDVLPAESYAAGHIPGALSLPVAEIPRRARDVLPDTDAEIVVYCGSFT